MTDRISKTKRNNKETLIVDYSRCTADEMIALLSELKEFFARENKLFYVLSIYSEDPRVTVKYMDQVRKLTPFYT